MRSEVTDTQRGGPQEATERVAPPSPGEKPQEEPGPGDSLLLDVRPPDREG